MRRSILVTGFEPFDASPINPSALLAERLNGSSIAGRPVTGVVLPVSAARVEGALFDAIERTEPEIVLGLGLAEGRAGLTVERVGINVLDFTIPDNDTYHAGGEPIVMDGPAAYFSTLPVKGIVAAWKEAGIPGAISNTAGAYICNQALYLALHRAQREGFRAGFIHVPYLPEQAAAARDREVPSMALDTMLDGVKLALEVTVAATSSVPFMETVRS